MQSTVQTLSDRFTHGLRRKEIVTKPERGLVSKQPEYCAAFASLIPLLWLKLGPYEALFPHGQLSKFS